MVARTWADRLGGSFALVWLVALVVAPLLALVAAAWPVELQAIERLALARALGLGLGLSIVVATLTCALALVLARVVTPAVLVALLLVSRTIVAHGVLGLGLRPGLLAAAVTLILDLAPFAALILSLRLRTRPMALIDAARDLGAGVGARAREVEWPHLRPAVLAAWSFGLLQSLGDVVAFELAGGGHGYTPGLLIRDALVREQAPARALVCVFALLVVAVPCAWLMSQELARAQRSDWRPIPRPSVALAAGGWLALLICASAPLRALIGDQPPGFGLVDRQLGELALWSLALAGLVAALAGVAGFGLALTSRRMRAPSWLTLAVLAPLAIPPSVLGLLVLVAAAQLGLAPGPALTVFALLGPGLALAFVAATLMIATIPRSLVDAARDLGAAGLDRLRLLWLPLGRPALIVAGIVAFAWSLGQAAIPSFTSGPGGDTLAVALTIHARAGSMALVRRWSIVLVALPVLAAVAVTFTAGRLGAPPRRGQEQGRS